MTSVVWVRLALACRNALAGIDILRKVCNHPDLLERAKAEGAEDYGKQVPRR